VRRDEKGGDVQPDENGLRRNDPRALEEDRDQLTQSRHEPKHAHDHGERAHAAAVVPLRVPREQRALRRPCDPHGRTLELERDGKHEQR